MQVDLTINSKYKIEKLLHKTNNNLLFLAQDTLQSTNVYLRVILFPNILDNAWQQIILYYRSVFEWLQGFNCPGIHTFDDFGYTTLQNFSPFVNLEKDTSICYFATNKSPTGTLLAENVDHEKIMDAAAKVLEILALLHGKKIYHYSLSPYSIFIENTGKVSLFDVGLIPLGHNFLHLSSYSPPELSHDFEHDGTSDVYSFGVTLFKMLTQNLQANVLPTEKSLEEVEPSLKKLITLSTANIPQERFTLSEVIQEFEQITDKKLQIPPEFGHLKNCFVGDSSFQDNLQRILLGLNKSTKKTKIFSLLVEGNPGEGKSQLLSQIAIQSCLHKVKCIATQFTNVNNPVATWFSLLKELHIDNFYTDAKSFNVPICLDISLNELYLQSREKIADSIIDYSCRKPLVLLFDDFHLADEFIIDTIRYIWYRCKSLWEETDTSLPRLFMVFTYSRPDTAKNLYSFFQEEIYNDELQSHLLHFQLSPFSVEQTGKCIATILNMSYIPEIFSASLYKVSKGNKLQIYEILRSMLKQGTLYREDDEWCVDSSLLLPPSLESAIENHIKTMPPLCEHILNILSTAKSALPVTAILTSFEVPGKEVIPALFYLVSSSVITIKKDFTVDFYNISFANYLQKAKPKVDKKEIVALGRSIEQIKNPRYDFVLSLLFDGTVEQEKSFLYTQKAIYNFLNMGLTNERFSCLEKYFSILEKADSVETVEWLIEVYWLLGKKQQVVSKLLLLLDKNPTPYVFLRLATSYFASDIKKTEHFSEKAFLALESNKQVAIENALYHVIKSNIYSKNNNFKEATSEIQKSLYYVIDNYNSLENKKAVVNFYCAILLSQEIWEHTAYLDNFLRHGKEIAQNINHLPGLAILHSVLGNRKKIEGKYAESLQAFQQAIALWERIKNPYREALILVEIAEVQAEIGDHEKLDVFLDKSMKIAFDNELDTIIARCYLVKTQSLYYSGKKEEAEIYLEKCVQIFQQYNEKYSLCLALLKWFEILIDSNESEEEIQIILEKIEKIVIVLKIPLLEIKLTLAKVKFYKNFSLEEIIPLLDSYYKIATDLNLYQYQWRILYEYGNSLRNTGDIQGALQKYQQAKKIMLLCLEGLRPEKIDFFLQTGTAKSLEKLLHMLTTELPVDNQAEPYTDVISSYKYSMEFDHLNALKDENSNLKKLLDINKGLLRERDLKKLLNFIMDIAIELTKAERGFIILSDTSTDKAFEVARNFEKEYIENPEFEISHSITEQVIKTGLAILSENAMEDERFNGFRSVAELNLYSILAVPLASQEKILGALYIDNRFEKSVFSQKEKTLLSAFAVQAALAIENARLLQENTQKQEHIKKLNEQLEIANNKLSQRVEKQEEELTDAKLILHRNKQELATKYSYRNIIGKSKQIQDLFTIIDKISDKNIPILIQGESGTGKELVARAIHFNSQRNKENFMSENCAAISDSLLANELFGHDKGAYTNAYSDKKGLFELAHKGTLFLDEVGDMSPSMQVNLLRVLETGYVRRLGGKDKIEVDVRIISASNKILQELVNKKDFREDLFFRLKVVQIDLPSLRHRKEDIPLLVDHFLKKYAEENKVPLKDIDKKGIDVLLDYHWPGNIRELRNIIYNVLSIHDDKKLTAIHFADLLENPSQKLENLFAEELSIDEYAKRFVLKNQEKYNDSQLAKILGFSRKTLWEKRKKWGISK